MKLYYTPGTCSLASHILLREAGLAFTLEKVDLKTKQTESGQDFKTINPKGYVPALELEDGEVLTENVALLSYIAARGGIAQPATGMAHWRTLEMTTFLSNELHKAFKPFFDPTSDDAAKAKAKDIIGARLDFLEAQLGDRAFIVGEDFSIADAYLFVMITWVKRLGLAVPAHLDAYAKRLSQRPSVADALQREGLTISF